MTQTFEEGEAEAARYFGLSETERNQLLGGCLKPDEITDTSGTHLKRVKELLHWFARFTTGNANPKWVVGHACELAYYVAVTDLSGNFDWQKEIDKAYLDGVQIPDDQRGTLERLKLVPPKVTKVAPGIVRMMEMIYAYADTQAQLKDNSGTSSRRLLLEALDQQDKELREILSALLSQRTTSAATSAPSSPTEEGNTR